MIKKKTKDIKINFSISKLKSLHKEEKNLKNDKKSFNKDVKYLSPVFSTMSGATYSFENC